MTNSFPNGGYQPDFEPANGGYSGQSEQQLNFPPPQPPNGNPNQPNAAGNPIGAMPQPAYPNQSGLSSPGYASLQGASFGPRFGAAIIDQLIYVFALIVPVVILSVIMDVMTANSTEDAGPAIAGMVVMAFLVLIIALAIFHFLIINMETSSGQTLGKKAMRIRTLSTTNAPLMIGQVYKRYCWWWVTYIPFLGGPLSLILGIAAAVGVSNPPNLQGFHDKWANTIVVKE
ncbi:RDD family protein [Corynebacterium kroppenstedtii]|uniref:RDD family protein n=1 Tax=Corynebacterium pseudokroppenstedtii TaxID=2804917 RepID=UPI00194E7485|nr:RDD family protein [Corynebacterium pseudokroppenstedtii]MDK7148475.1 RDD family protein [Corynebacterium pseudokroppenstedtii]QRP14720.1 RDD family protein [Corynebacterium kroppenstedtii]